MINVDDTNEAQRFHVGTTIAGRYRVERPIGEGAMGAVALARHISLDETVAIKFLRPELRRDPVAIDRLSREARALARIKSDHVARVLDVGATLSVGPYMVMEYLEGTDLGELLEAEGPLPVSRAVECVLQVCEALTVAHTAGIVHRDIKPHNLFLARHGQFETLKVLDFGICDGAAGSAASGDGTPYGTPLYMSPERVRNEPGADHRADIWSIGVVLHELVTGRAPFDGGALTDICARIVSDAPPDLCPDVTVLPANLRAIIARCLEREPSRRYQSVEELAAALAPLGTMHERFRGRTTGAFSRKMIEQELESTRAPVVARAPAALSAGEATARGPLAPLLGRLGGVLRPRALVSAAAGVVVLASLVRGAAWVAPPPVPSGLPVAEPARAAGQRALEAAPSAEPPGLIEARPSSVALAPEVASSPREGSGAAVEASDEAAPPRATRRERRHATRARARAKQRAARAARARASAAMAPEESAETAERRPRVSRVRLVEDRHALRPAPAAEPVEQVEPVEPVERAEPRAAQAVDDGAPSRPLPDWLRAYREP